MQAISAISAILATDQRRQTNAQRRQTNIFPGISEI
jgi:hypothetical protein